MAATRRDKGSGEQPRWRPSEGRWRARYVDALGVRRSVYSSTPGRAGAREAAAKRDEAIRRAELGIVSNPHLTVGDLLERWLTEVAPLRLRPSSLVRYRGIIREQLLPTVGRIPLAALAPEHVARAYAELAAPREVTINHARARYTEPRARSQAAIRYAHAVLHRALDQAVIWRLIERNPATGAVLPRRSRPEMRPLSTPEARRFLEATGGHPLEALFTLALTTGMRKGELLGLRWRDVDWATRRISIHHTLVRLHGRWWLGDPKTAKSERSVTLTDPTIDLLRAHRAHQAERLLAIGHRLTDDDFLFSDDAGDPLWGRHVTTREFGPLLRQAELPPIRFHDLRHTFATLQLAAGTNPKIVSEVLGHKDVAITLDRYSHALPTMQTEAMARLDALLGRSPLDAADDALGEAPQEPELWLDQESGAAAIRPVGGHKGSDKGPNKGPHGGRRAAKRPDPSSDQAENGGFGTAYRMRGIPVSCVPVWVIERV